MADQLRYDALGCNGNPVCRTPNIDALAGDGVRFQSAYSSISLCSPARATMMTGLYPHKHGQLSNTENFNSVFSKQVLDCTNLPFLLKQAGYQTGYVGKWHLPEEFNPQIWPFDFWEKAATGNEGFELGRDVVQPLEWGGDAPFEGESTLPPEEHQEYRVADRSIEMIGKLKETDSPFTLIASFFGPHFPYSVPKPYYGMYDSAAIDRPGNFDETFENKPLIQQKEQLRWNSSHLTWPDWQKVISTYWAYCTFIDDQVGRIIDHLKNEGLYDDTIVIFTTDHGDMLGNHRLFNKGFHMYEETHHIPFIIRVPGINEGSTCEAFVGTVDIMPTILNCAGTLPEMNLDGRSILPLVEGKTPDDWPREVYAQFHGYESTLATVRMVRNKRWKYVYNPYSIDELYDMVSDPGELVNLAPRLGFKHVLRRMKDRMVYWLKATDDDIATVGTWQSNSYDLIVSDRER